VGIVRLVVRVPSTSVDPARASAFEQPSPAAGDEPFETSARRSFAT